MINRNITNRIIFPSKDNKDWRGYIISKLKKCSKGLVEFDTGNWNLKCKDLKDLENLCSSLSLRITYIESYLTETIVSANSLGMQNKLKVKEKKVSFSETSKSNSGQDAPLKLFLHQGTLRSGERLETEGDLLIVGDVNPGAMVSAGGSIMIWGRLLGIAHAGKEGNINAKISALQLRPVQLRIASKIARGPKESPEDGLAEEAVVKEGVILIQPATTK